MRKTLIFAIFVSLVVVDAVYAVDWTSGDANASSYPDWASGKPTTAKQLQVKDANVTVATTNYVKSKVNAISGSVTSLASSATADNATVTANGTAITAMESGRLVHPTNRGDSNCPSNSVCGYISASGTNGTKQWVEIIQSAN